MAWHTCLLPPFLALLGAAGEACVGETDRALLDGLLGLTEHRGSLQDSDASGSGSSYLNPKLSTGLFELLTLARVLTALLLFSLSLCACVCVCVCAGQWDSMEEYTCMIPRDTHDGAFYRAVLALHQDLFSLAQQVKTYVYPTI